MKLESKPTLEAFAQTLARLASAKSSLLSLQPRKAVETQREIHQANQSKQRPG